MMPNKIYKKSLKVVFGIIATTVLFGFAVLPANKKVVVCFGDSITHGAMVDGHSWVWYLQQEQLQTPYVYINEGRSGRRTADRQELLPVLDRYPEADMYVFFLGVNDLKNGNDSMVAACARNMQWMINQVRRKAPRTKILLLAPSDINTKIMTAVNSDKLYNENTRESLKKLAIVYKGIAKKNKIGFMSLLKVVPRLAYADGLHPDSKGQLALYKAIDKKIISYDSAE